MKIQVTEKHIELAPKLFKKGRNASECCPIACAVAEKFPKQTVSVGWCDTVNNEKSHNLFHDFFYISLKDKKDEMVELEILNKEECSRFAEKYDDGQKVNPFEFEIKKVKKGK